MRMVGIWKYRGFIQSSVRREFQARYRGSLLGVAWTVLNPLAMILVYTLIFSQIMKARLPDSDMPFAYSIYLMAGLLPWTFFAEVLMRSQSIFLDNANIIKKVNVPKLCFPIISFFNASFNFLIVLSLFLIFLVLIGQFPTHAFWAFLPIMLIQISLAFGLGILLGVLNVFFRDVGQFIGIFLQFWFWLTPIIYSATILPDWIAPYALLNPMAPVVGAYQSIFLQNAIPQWSTLLPSMITAVIVSGVAWYLYRRTSDEMVDEL
jgi:lipopolysaccharide transport system permease protein